MRKKVIACISFLILIVVMSAMVLVFKTDTRSKDSEKLQIVATLFPQYDFTKQIVGDKADVKLLLNSGVEAHNYEPTVKDMITILDDSDMFVYTGTTLEPWTEKIVKNLEETDCDILDISKNINLITIHEFEEKHINSEIVNSEEHDGHNDEMYDEHIWLSMSNAIIMIDNILEEICNIDPENAEYYKTNAETYKNEIYKLDEQYKQLVQNAQRNEIAVGGEFAYSYLVEEYGLNFVSVYTNCGEGEDPSISKVKSVIDYINNHNLPVVYYEELSEGTVAKMIAEETEAEALVLYSIHNGNPDEDTYVSLMEKNLESLRKGLN